MAKETILITGGFGLIGGRLGQHLSNDYRILLGSRTKQESPRWLPQAKTVEIDWNSKESLNKVCSQVDVIIHASGMNAQECSSKPDQALIVNGFYTKNLVEEAINQGVKKIVYLSSAHVYDSTLSGVISEQNQTLNSHPYATSHIYGEKSILLAMKKGTIDGFVVRLSNAFGSPTHKDVNCWMLLVSDLCKQAITKKILTLNSSGEQIRDFVTISDVCSSINYLIKRRGRQDSNIINIGSGRSCTIKEMASRIQNNCDRVLGFKPVMRKEKSMVINRENNLDFKTNYLDQINFKFVNNFDKEIEDLLYFCKENFTYEG